MMTHEKIYLFAFSHCATVPFRFMEFIMLRLFFFPLQSRCCSTFIHKHEMLCFFSVLCSFSTLLQFFLLRHTFPLSSLYHRDVENRPSFSLRFLPFRCSPVRAEGMCRFDMTTLWVNRKTEHRKLLARLFETWTSRSEEVKSKHRANCKFSSSPTLVVTLRKSHQKLTRTLNEESFSPNVKQYKFHRKVIIIVPCSSFVLHHCRIWIYSPSFPFIFFSPTIRMKWSGDDDDICVTERGKLLCWPTKACHRASAVVVCEKSCTKAQPVAFSSFSHTIAGITYQTSIIWFSFCPLTNSIIFTRPSALLRCM